MIKKEFSNGNTHEFKNAWEELSTKEFLYVVDYLSLLTSGVISLAELRQLTFYMLTGLRPTRLRNAEKAQRQAENIYRIAQEINFMVRINYDAGKSFAKLRKEVREQLTRYLPSELEQTPEVRWAAKKKCRIEPDLVFAKNLIPHIGRRRHKLPGYTFNLDGKILTTSLSASQFIEAQTVALEIMESGNDELLNLLVAILYNKSYDPQKAIEQSKQLHWLDQRTKNAILVNFNAIQAFLFTRTKYRILFTGPDPKKKKKHNLGLGSAVHSLIKSGYSDIDNANLIKFFEIMYDDLVSSVVSLHKQEVPIDKIAEQTGLSLETINQIL